MLSNVDLNAEMELLQQKMVEAKKKKLMDSLRKVKELCREFDFMAGMLSNALTDGRKK